MSLVDQEIYGDGSSSSCSIIVSNILTIVVDYSYHELYPFNL